MTPASAEQRAEIGALLEHPEDHQVCEERRGVTYCAFPAYAPWIDRWAEAVEGALDRIPPAARPSGIVVRQRFGSYFEGPIDAPEDALREAERARRRTAEDDGPGTTLWTATEWGRGNTEGGYALGLGLSVAMEALDFPSSRADMVPSDAETQQFARGVLPLVEPRFRDEAERALTRRKRTGSCSTMHQARALAALWIGAQATPATRAAVTRAAAENPYGLTFYDGGEGRQIATYIGPFLPIYPELPPPMWDRITFGSAEFHYAAQLLQQGDDDEVAATLAARWDELSAPSFPTGSLLGELGLAPHPTIEEQIAELPDDVDLERRRGMWHPDAYFVQMTPCF